MHCIIAISALVLLAVSSEALRCYTGTGDNPASSERDCDPGVNYCVKTVGRIGSFNGTARGCAGASIAGMVIDTCQGTGCSETGGQAASHTRCCCDGNLCNSASSAVISAVAVLLGAALMC